MVFNNGPHTHALIDLPTRYSTMVVIFSNSIEDVIKLSRVVHRTGLTTAESLRPICLGLWLRSLFRFTVMLDVSCGRSPIKRNIIASGRIRKSTRCLLSGMAVRGKPFKMVLPTVTRPYPNLKVGENEKLVGSWCIEASHRPDATT